MASEPHGKEGQGPPAENFYTAGDSLIRSIELSDRGLKDLRKRRNVKNNSVRTSKYTLLTFIPYNLFE